MGVLRRFGEDALHDTFGQIAAALILFLDNFNFHAHFDVGSFSAVHCLRFWLPANVRLVYTNFVIMIEIGIFQNLQAVRSTPHGMILHDAEGDDVLLPKKYQPAQLQEGDYIEVFVYTDSEDWPIATTQQPLAVRNQFAYLTVKEVSSLGAWMDIGLDKDLLVPFSEQPHKLHAGESCPIYVYLDETTNRLVGSARLRRFLDQSELSVSEGEAVNLFLTGRSDLGMKAIVNERHEGLIFDSDIFGPLQPGQRLRAYIKKIREDNKLDLRLQPKGYAKVEPNADKILHELREAGGFLPLHDKSDPDAIREQLHMSKKTFKKAIGGLYKEGQIVLEDHGIRLKG